MLTKLAILFALIFIVSADVRIRATPQLRFVPARARVRAGETIVWEGLGHNHNVVQVAGPNEVQPMRGGFYSGSPGEKQAYAIRINQPGRYYYICQAHVRQGMRGEIIVE